MDQKKSRWAGRRCPDCERQRVRTAIKLDRFKRQLVIQQLEAEGYKLKSQTFPMLVEKDAVTYTVGVQFVSAGDGQIHSDGELTEGCDLYALVFESVRILPAHRLTALNLNVKSPAMTSNSGASSLSSPNESL